MDSRADIRSIAVGASGVVARGERGSSPLCEGQRPRPVVPTRVLVVDDHVALAENLAEILEVAGYPTAIAASAERALARAARGDIKLLVTDFALPGANGLELIDMIRHLVGAIPAIVISAFLEDDLVSTAWKAGALDVLAKPIAPDNFITAVRAVISPAALGAQ